MHATLRRARSRCVYLPLQRSQHLLHLVRWTWGSLPRVVPLCHVCGALNAATNVRVDVGAVQYCLLPVGRGCKNCSDNGGADQQGPRVRTAAQPKTMSSIPKTYTASPMAPPGGFTLSTRLGCRDARRGRRGGGRERGREAGRRRGGVGVWWAWSGCGSLPRFCQPRTATPLRYLGTAVAYLNLQYTNTSIVLLSTYS